MLYNHRHDTRYLWPGLRVCRASSLEESLAMSNLFVVYPSGFHSRPNQSIFALLIPNGLSSCFIYSVYFIYRRKNLRFAFKMSPFAFLKRFRGHVFTNVYDNETFCLFPTLSPPSLCPPVSASPTPSRQPRLPCPTQHHVQVTNSRRSHRSSESSLVSSISCTTHLAL